VVEKFKRKVHVCWAGLAMLLELDRVANAIFHVTS
jgi:hypothetical protein